MFEKEFSHDARRQLKKHFEMIGDSAGIMNFRILKRSEGLKISYFSTFLKRKRSERLKILVFLEFLNTRKIGELGKFQELGILRMTKSQEI